MVQWGSPSSQEHGCGPHVRHKVRAPPSFGNDLVTWTKLVICSPSDEMAIIIGFLALFRIDRMGSKQSRVKRMWTQIRREKTNQGSRIKGREDAPGMLKRTVLASWEMRCQDWASMSAPGGKNSDYFIQSGSLRSEFTLSSWPCLCFSLLIGEILFVFLEREKTKFSQF